MNNKKTRIILLLLLIPVVTIFAYSCAEFGFKAGENSKYDVIENSLCNITNIEMADVASAIYPTATIRNGSFRNSQENNTILDCKVIYQKPSLPNGCEITATTIVLQYLGYSVTKEEMSDVYLEKGEPYYLTDPNVAFMGNPRSSEAWYCFPPVIVKAVNKYFTENNYTQHIAKDCTNSTLKELREYIDEGFPIICWATSKWEPVVYNYTFSLRNGGLTYSNLHCLVISGHFVENGIRFYQITDPAKGVYNITEATLQSIYNAMGKRCVVIVDN